MRVYFLLSYFSFFLSPIAFASDTPNTSDTTGITLCPQRDNVAIVGVAQTTAGDKLLYCEYHYLKNTTGELMPSVVSMGDAMASKVEYRNQSQQLIATKLADFSSSQLAPNVEQVDERHGEKLSMQPQTVGEESNADIAVIYQAANTLEQKKAIVDAGNGLVIDAGFDNAIRAYWDDIVAGNKVIVEFVAPAQQTTVNLSIKSRSIRRCNKLSPTTVYDDSTHLCITAQAANVILNWFVKPITLVYERDKQRLIMFSGSVNITDDQGSAQSALIRYYYY
ncbi:hypothetical protein ACVBE9_08670 [Eionea flava]